MDRIFFSASLVFMLLFNLIVPSRPSAAEPQDIIARVGDQAISFSEIDIMINSSSVIGMDIPAYGTPARNEARLRLLDKMISADLLYLDALKTGQDKNPDYQKKVKAFSDNVLAALYKEKVMQGDVPVSDAEIRDYFKKNIAPGTEFTPDVQMAIESKIRREKFKAKNEGMRKKLRDGVTVLVESKELEPAGDSSRKASTVIAKINNEEIVWGDLKAFVAKGSGLATLANRRKALDTLIDERIMASKGRASGMEKDPLFQTRVNEFKKTSLISMYQGKLFTKFAPDDAELRSYYEKNKNKVIVPESRKVQMMVLKTRKEADEIKKKIASKKLTFFQAARDFSIDPNAKQNLGEIGWVAKGSGFPDLDKKTFSLKKDELGGPVESPVGWHLVKVLEVRESRYEDINDKKTQDVTRQMLMHEKLDQYTAMLRKEKFPVVIYDDVYSKLVAQEKERVKKNEAARASKLQHE